MSPEDTAIFKNVDIATREGHEIPYAEWLLLNSRLYEGAEQGKPRKFKPERLFESFLAASKILTSYTEPESPHRALRSKSTLFFQQLIMEPLIANKDRIPLNDIIRMRKILDNLRVADEQHYSDLIDKFDHTFSRNILALLKKRLVSLTKPK